MRSKLFAGAAVLAVAAGAVLLGGRPASAGAYYWGYDHHGSMYYPWAWQFPWDRPGTVNPDVLSGPLLATSTHWLPVSDYGFYRPSFVPGHPCRRHPTRECW